MCRISGIFKVLSVFLFLFGNGIPLFAETELHFDGEVRFRSEIEDKDLIPVSNRSHFYILRARVGVSALIDGNTIAYVQFQDSRILGGKNQYGEYQSGTLNDSKNVDLHQGYLLIKEIWKNGPSVKAGRFEVNYGNQRVFGSNDWDNVGRAWEGVMLSWQRPFIGIDGFFLKLRESNDNRDMDVYGIYSIFDELGLHLFGFYEYNNDRAGGRNTMDRYNTGLYLKSKYANFDFETNIIYQFGNMFAYWASDQAIYEDISAYLLAFETGYTLSIYPETRVAVGIDYTSGDLHPTIDGFSAYRGNYYSAHKFRGYFDEYDYDVCRGLVDLYFYTQIQPAKGWSFEGACHSFRLDEPYDSGYNSHKKLGIEFDIKGTTRQMAGVLLEGGMSIFDPAGEIYGLGSETGYWLYGMITANFEK